MLSFSVYVLPVVTPHWIDLFGLALGRELFGEREVAWKAADVALAVMLQAVLFGWIRTVRSAGYALDRDGD